MCYQILHLTPYLFWIFAGEIQCIKLWKSFKIRKLDKAVIKLNIYQNFLRQISEENFISFLKYTLRSWPSHSDMWIFLFYLSKTYRKQAICLFTLTVLGCSFLFYLHYWNADTKIMYSLSFYYQTQPGLKITKLLVWLQAQINLIKSSLELLYMLSCRLEIKLISCH